MSDCEHKYVENGFFCYKCGAKENNKKTPKEEMDEKYDQLHKNYTILMNDHLNLAANYDDLDQENQSLVADYNAQYMKYVILSEKMILTEECNKLLVDAFMKQRLDINCPEAIRLMRIIRTKGRR